MTEPFLTVADIVTDPDAALRRAREQAPVVSTDMGPLVTRYEPLRSVLQDPRFSINFPRFLEQMGVSSGPFHEWTSRSPLNMDGEPHRRWRRLMSRTFTPQSVERLRPFLREEAHRLIDEFVGSGQCEFMDAFARKLPSLGLCELIGVPSADRTRFCGWADTIGLGFNLILLPTRIQDIDAALLSLLEYAKGLVAERRRTPREDLVSRLAVIAQEEDGVDEQVVIASVAGLVFAGHETTKNQLGWAVAVLAECPEEWERVAREPARAKPAVEEVLRFRSAATSVGRTVNEPLELFGVEIGTNERLIGSLWSANRDPGEFKAPDTFDVDANQGGAQIAFGHGPHHCLGAALARAELQESLIALTARFACPRVLPGAEFLPPVGINGPSVLPIAFSERRR